jgi:hypothetical protein
MFRSRRDHGVGGHHFGRLEHIGLAFKKSIEKKWQAIDSITGTSLLAISFRNDFAWFEPGANRQFSNPTILSASIYLLELVARRRDQKSLKIANFCLGCTRTVSL